MSKSFLVLFFKKEHLAFLFCVALGHPSQAAAPDTVRLAGATLHFAHQPMTEPARIGTQPNIAGLSFFADPRPAPSFGFGHQRWWARADIDAAITGPRFLRVDAPSSDEIAAFLQCGGTEWHSLPRLRLRYAVFPADLAPGRHCAILVMEETRSVVRFPLTVLSAAALAAPGDETLIGAVLGTSTAACVFVFFLWTVTRRPEFLHFIAYQLAASLVILRIWGFLPGVALTEYPRLCAWLGVAGLNLWILEYFNYVRASLNLAGSHPRLNRALTILTLGVWPAILGETLHLHFQWPLTVANMAIGLACYITVIAARFRAEPTRVSQQILGYAPTIVCFAVYLVTLAGYAGLADLRLLFLLGQIGSTLALSQWMAQSFQRDRDRREASLAASVGELQANRVQLERYQNDLERMVDERTAALTRALENERDIVAQQRDFTSMVGHEFRTPLAVIDGQARRITRAASRAADPGMEDDLVRRGREIREAVRGMIGLMEGLLSHARGEAGWNNLRLETADLRALVERAAGNAIPAERANDVAIEFAETLHCRADPALLGTAIGNILSNAAKYSEIGTPIRLLACRRDGQLHITIDDHGIGIAAGEHEAVFARFQRGSNALTTAGAGIGLYVARQIIEQHRGAIEMKSALGRGTSFTITLPPITETEAT